MTQDSHCSVFSFSSCLGLIFGALVSFFLSKELYSQSRQQLIAFPTSAGVVDNSATYPPSFSYDVDEHDTLSSADKCADNMSKASEVELLPIGGQAICNKIGSRKPFSVERSPSSSYQTTRNHSVVSERTSSSQNNHITRDIESDHDIETVEGGHVPARARYPMSNSHTINNNPAPRPSDWPTKIAQYNPFYNKDKYERIAESDTVYNTT